MPDETPTPARPLRLRPAHAQAVHWLALGASIACGTAGQLLMKAAAVRTVGVESSPGTLAALAIAIAVYALGVANWIVALRGVGLGVAYSIGSLTYVGVLAGSCYWFGESIALARAAGVALIMLGVVIVAAGPAR